GHLLLVPALFDLPEPDLNGVAIAHLGTLLAILIYFRRDLWQIATAMLSDARARQPLASSNARLGWYIAVGTVPAVVAGLLFDDLLDEIFGQPRIAAILLLGTAAILLLGERLLTGAKELSQMGWLDGIVIGLAQVTALLPGISRSGVTISAGLGRGLNRWAAARYSFLLGVPAISGAGVLAVVDLLQQPDLGGQAAALTVSFVTAGVVGYACIHFLLRWVRQRSLHLFAAYCAAFGSLSLLLLSL
ncbi:MAG: undecaprenyl-diphosphate phosphatase, partial [Candidatus Promineifilaceae bacterium]|nr:undecaprenyl-diphosphate phosphatase [Candidatus Promineifilaceae bacterium]